ncbi:MAG TPA: GTP-binding protein [Burkholderiales bacterium]|nr:GTP-binding protein [Burkholderiales bacterium]
MTSKAIPTHLVTGATGAGKTMFVARLLAQKPRGERWAVLVNDFGLKTLRDAPGVSEGEVMVREVAGCICCSAQVAVRTALIALIRAARPHRLLIEASAAAEPDALLSVLREPGIAPAVALRPTLAIASASQLANAHYLANALYRKQLRAADGVVISAATEEEDRAGRAILRDITRPDKPVYAAAAFALPQL